MRFSSALPPLCDRPTFRNLYRGGERLRNAAAMTDLDRVTISPEGEYP